MKPSDIGKKLMDGVKTFAHFAPVAMAVASDKLPDGTGFFADLGKGIHGVLSSRDEREFEILLQQLENEDDMRGMRPRLTITRFMQWHFQKRCLGEQVVSWWYGNDFRAFVVKLSDKTKPDDRTSLDFLKWMVKVIHSEEVTSRGFEKLVQQLDHVPHVPEGASSLIGHVQNFLARTSENAVQAYRDTKAGLIRHTRRVERQVEMGKAKPKSFLDYLIK